MNIILLSGGSGKRLWPLSNGVRSKQFIPIFKTRDGDHISMLQSMFRHARKVNPESNILVATSLPQVPEIEKQIGEDVLLSIEPERKGTFPAIILAAMRLAELRGLEMNETVVVCPVDPLVEELYFHTLSRLSEIATRPDVNIAFLGIAPTHPSTKYGYIVPRTTDELSPILSFKEKPDATGAKELIAKGALWNGGVFAFKVSYAYRLAKERFGVTSYQELCDIYQTLEADSFDYAVAEHETKGAVLRFSGTWIDLGTWDALSEAMKDIEPENASISSTCSNVTVVNNLDLHIIANGLHDVVIAASPEGILVSDKEKSSEIKPFVDELSDNVMYAEKSWGSFRIIDVNDDYQTLRVTLNKGHHMSYHSHDRRDEIWTVAKGTGLAVIDGIQQVVRPGDTLRMNRGQKHTIKALDDELVLIEVQFGKDISILDKTKYPFVW